MPTTVGDTTSAQTQAFRRQLSIESTQASDRYVLLGRLGAGSMGDVLRVRDSRLDRSLAMKVLLREHRKNNVLRECFLEEAQAMARLQHPGILPLYDVGELADGRPYFTMQEVHG